MIRLCKRMSELDFSSRREADRLIEAGKVFVNGEKAVLGQTVESTVSKDSICIIHNDDGTLDQELESTVRAVVLNKPSGYVSGQEEHGHLPAIRLLRRDNLWSGDDNVILPSSWKGFAPAGRLDLDSSGLLVFCSSGVVAKKIIHHESKLEKEYVVDVEPAIQATRRELAINPAFVLPKPSPTDLCKLREGGQFLLGDHRPLQPFPEATWLQPGKRLRLILREGRKHHIRRVSRELLGYHVVRLQRIRIGPINLGDLPEGFWRPLRDPEWDVIMS